MNTKNWMAVAGIAAVLGGAASIAVAGEHSGMMGGTMGGRGAMGTQGGGTMGCPMMSGGGMGGMMGGANAGRGGMPTLPPGNEKLQLQMQAEIMQKVGEIMAKYAGQIETR